MNETNELNQRVQRMNETNELKQAQKSIAAKLAEHQKLDHRVIDFKVNNFTFM